MKLLKGIAFALANGFILFFYSERLFWTVFRPDDSIVDHVITWVFYSVLAYVFLWVVRYFRVRSLWALYIAGAIYGWLAEGVLTYTLYGTQPEARFPISISWTGLAFHASITIMAGWYYVRKTLIADSLVKTVTVASLIGLYWGFWAIFQWRENPPLITPIKDFALYAFAISSLLILSYRIINKLNPAFFRPGKLGLIFCALILLFFFVFQNVMSLGLRPIIILPALLLIVCLALRKNRKTETRPDLLDSISGKVRIANYLLLLFVPISATIFYSIAFFARLSFIPVNYILYFTMTPIGFIMLIISLLKTYWLR